MPPLQLKSFGKFCSPKSRKTGVFTNGSKFCRAKGWLCSDTQASLTPSRCPNKVSTWGFWLGKLHEIAMHPSTKHFVSKTCPVDWKLKTPEWRNLAGVILLFKEWHIYWVERFIANLKLKNRIQQGPRHVLINGSFESFRIFPYFYPPIN